MANRQTVVNRLGISEAARRSGYDKQYIRRRCREGVITFRKTPEDRFEIDEPSLQQYCEKQKRPYRFPPQETEQA